MALKIYDKYQPLANAPTAEYPTGSVKNKSSKNAADGTPIEADWANDFLGLRDAILAAGGVTADGNVETATSSQVVEALKAFLVERQGDAELNNLSITGDADFAAMPKVEGDPLVKEKDVAKLLGAEALTKADRMSPCFKKTGAQDLDIKAGTSVLVDGALIHFESDTPVALPSLTAGEDYAVFVNPDGTIEAVADPFSTPASAPQPGSRKIGGFHYGLVSPTETVAGGNFATSGPGMHWTQGDVDKIRGINEFTIWDVRFRSAGEQHGFAFDPQAKVWVALYYCGPDHIADGISRYNSAVASDTVPPKIPIAYGGNGSAVYTTYTGGDADVAAGCWWNFMEVAHSHGARMLWEHEFNSAAFGTTENIALGGASSTIPATKREPGYTSRIGLEQVTGHHYTWGMDSNFREDGSGGAGWYDKNGNRGNIYLHKENGIVRVRLGGARGTAAADCGSRTAAWSGYPWSGSWTYGLRAACEHLQN